MIHFYLLSYIGVLFAHFIMVKCYKILTKKKYKLNIKDIIIIVFISLFSMFNNFYNYSIYRLIVHFLLICLMNKIIFKDEIKTIFYYTIPIYTILTLFDLLAGFLFSLSNFNTIKELDKNVDIKFLYSTLIILLTWLIFCIEKTRDKIKRFSIFLYKKNDIITIIICIGLIIIISYSTYENLYNYGSLKDYFYNCIPIIIFIIIFAILIKQIINVQKAEEKQESLLSFIKKYEIMVDNKNEKEHEMLNNLLVLKSFKDKNTKEYENELNKFINMYKNPKKKTLQNLNNFPSGLKGIIHFKVDDIEKQGIKLQTNFNNNSIKYLDNLNSDVYVKITKIIGILIDNAIEAATESLDKLLNISIYKDNKIIVFKIENSTKNHVDINLINKQNYSTKGKGRGLGLFIVNKIIKRNRELTLNQEYSNNIFTTKLIINCK